MLSAIASYILAHSALQTLLYLLAAVWAAVRFAAHPRVSALAMTGFALLLAGQVGSSGLSVMYLPEFRGELSLGQVAARTQILRLAVTAVYPIGMVFILLAIFSDRGSEQRLDAAPGASWPNG